MRQRPGLTLIEMVVVIILIGLIVGLVAPQVFGRVGEAKDTAAKAQMATLGTALDNYRLDNGSYPATSQGLRVLRENPGGTVASTWRGPYLRKDVPLDPWGRAWVYASPGTRNPNGFDLMTLGRDGKAGGTGEDADLIGQ